MDRERAARSLAATAAGFHARGWCVGTSGNFSAVLAREPLEILITTSGVDKGQLGPGDFVLVDAEARPLPGEAGRASAETPLHATVAERTGAGCVLHTHSVAATLLGEHFLDKGGFSLSGYEMLKGLAGIATHEAAELVPIVPNAQDMRTVAGQVGALLERHPDLHGFLMAGHGLYTWGRDIDEARRHVEIFEFLFELVARRTELTPFLG
jgi:methylthioribulose-1-phosphate dehydratase